MDELNRWNWIALYHITWRQNELELGHMIDEEYKHKAELQRKPPPSYEYFAMMINPSFHLENYFWDEVALCDRRYASAM